MACAPGQFTQQYVRSYFIAMSAHLKAYAKHRRDRKTSLRMLQMDNRALLDIGLTRDDIREQIARSHLGSGG